jgi:hypothetical protein
LAYAGGKAELELKADAKDTELYILMEHTPAGSGT